jgi:hypothetical protein
MDFNMTNHYTLFINEYNNFIEFINTPKNINIICDNFFETYKICVMIILTYILLSGQNYINTSIINATKYHILFQVFSVPFIFIFSNELRYNYNKDILLILFLFYNILICLYFINNIQIVSYNLFCIEKNNKEKEEEYKDDDNEEEEEEHKDDENEEDENEDEEDEKEDEEEEVKEVKEVKNENNKEQSGKIKLSDACLNELRPIIDCDERTLRLVVRTINKYLN